MYSSLPQRKARKAAARLHKAAAEALPGHVPRQSSGCVKVAHPSSPLLALSCSEARNGRKVWDTELMLAAIAGLFIPAQTPEQ